jgi:hypothetical protein
VAAGGKKANKTAAAPVAAARLPRRIRRMETANQHHVKSVEISDFTARIGLILSFLLIGNLVFQERRAVKRKVLYK